MGCFSCFSARRNGVRRVETENGTRSSSRQSADSSGSGPCVCVYVVKKEQDFVASLRLILYFIVVELYFILLSLTGTILFIFSCWDVDLQVVGGERRIPVQMVRVTTILKLWVFLVKCNYEDGRS